MKFLIPEKTKWLLYIPYFLFCILFCGTLKAETISTWFLEENEDPFDFMANADQAVFSPDFKYFFFANRFYSIEDGKQAINISKPQDQKSKISNVFFLSKTHAMYKSQAAIKIRNMITNEDIKVPLGSDFQLLADRPMCFSKKKFLYSLRNINDLRDIVVIVDSSIPDNPKVIPLEYLHPKKDWYYKTIENCTFIDESIFILNANIYPSSHSRSDWAIRYYEYSSTTGKLVGKDHVLGIPFRNLVFSENSNFFAIDSRVYSYALGKIKPIAVSPNTHFDDIWRGSGAWFQHGYGRYDANTIKFMQFGANDSFSSIAVSHPSHATGTVSLLENSYALIKHREFDHEIVDMRFRKRLNGQATKLIPSRMSDFFILSRDRSSIIFSEGEQIRIFNTDSGFINIGPDPATDDFISKRRKNRYVFIYDSSTNQTIGAAHLKFDNDTVSGMSKVSIEITTLSI